MPNSEDPINRCARVRAAAHGGQVLLTKDPLVRQLESIKWQPPPPTQIGSQLEVSKDQLHNELCIDGYGQGRFLCHMKVVSIGVRTVRLGRLASCAETESMRRTPLLAPALSCRRQGSARYRIVDHDDGASAEGEHRWAGR